MRLYHFTTLEALKPALYYGLKTRPTPLPESLSLLEAVWLTSEKAPEEQGWADRGDLVCRARLVRLFSQKLNSRFRWRLEPSRKLEARVEIEVPETPYLCRFRDWADLDLSPSHAETIFSVLPADAANWWVYLDDIHPKFMVGAEVNIQVAAMADPMPPLEDFGTMPLRTV